jgi:hypothetical protein
VKHLNTGTFCFKKMHGIHRADGVARPCIDVDPASRAKETLRSAIITAMVLSSVVLCVRVDSSVSTGKRADPRRSATLNNLWSQDGQLAGSVEKLRKPVLNWVCMGY